MPHPYGLALRDPQTGQFVSIVPAKFPFDPNNDFTVDEVLDYVMHNFVTFDEDWIMRRTQYPLMFFHDESSVGYYMGMVYRVKDWHSLGWDLERVR